MKIVGLRPILTSEGAGADVAWHALAADVVVQRLASDSSQGLSGDEVDRRRRTHGANILTTKPERTRWRILVDQYANLLSGVLVVAAVVSGAIGETGDALAIAAILVLNGALGYAQERNAAASLASLRAMTAPQARVRRTGMDQRVAAHELVPGDIVLLEAGDRVPADVRLLTAYALRTVEAALTGESAAVEKDTGACTPDAPIHDRRCMAYLGTHVTEGASQAVVVATGDGTELGRIARLVRSATDEPTPLQRQLEALGRRLVAAAGVVVLAVFVLGLLRGTAPLEMFLASVSLAVAAIPEGLPAIVTIALSLGVARMARRNAVVRRLPAVEALGCTTVLCTDKTGTLTMGQMRATVVETPLGGLEIDAAGTLTVSSGSADPAVAKRAAGETLAVGASCSTARVVELEGRRQIIGDPTEGAIIEAALAVASSAARAMLEAPITGQHPFDPARRRMSVARNLEGSVVLHVKGAPEAVLARCTHLRGAAGRQPLSPQDRAEWASTNAMLAERGLRVLAIAMRTQVGPHLAPDPDRDERDLELLGFVGIEDPPRPEARAAVRACERAGIRTVMITGDQAGTALAVARSLGIAQRAEEVATGAELEAVSEEDLVQRVERTRVYARTSPEQKLRIVRGWRQRGDVVAMTGDGVNDAPALRAADVGVAVGADATDVAKEASDIVLTDGNFATIVAAVEEGRGIYENIRKSVLYLLGGNLGEILLVAAAVLLGFPLPLLPIQLLWINLVTDGLPALALATDAPEPDLLARSPRRSDAALPPTKSGLPNHNLYRENVPQA